MKGEGQHEGEDEHVGKDEDADGYDNGTGQAESLIISDKWNTFAGSGPLRCFSIIIVKLKLVLLRVIRRMMTMRMIVMILEV